MEEKSWDKGALVFMEQYCHQAELFLVSENSSVGSFNNIGDDEVQILGTLGPKLKGSSQPLSTVVLSGLGDLLGHSLVIP